MKDHEIAIMEVAGEFFDKGYNVYLEYKIYRFPNDPKLRHLKYRVDVLAIKDNDYLLIEVGYCSKKKLLELKHLVPSARVIHLCQWKNFVPINSLKQIDGYSVELPFVRKKAKSSKPIHKWSPEETKQIISLCQTGKSYFQIAEVFPNYKYHAIVGYIDRLYRKNLIKAKPKSLNMSLWSPDDLKKLVKLYSEGLTFKTIAKAFPNKKYLSIASKIQHLHIQGKLHFRKYVPDWTDAQDKLLLNLWNQEKTIKQIQESSGLTTRTVEAITSRVHLLRKRGLITTCRISLRKQGTWTPEKDMLLKELINKNISDGEITSYFPSNTYNNIRSRSKYLHSVDPSLRKRKRLPELLS